MNKTVETIGDATGETGWRKTYARKWTPPAQVCGAWRRKVEQTPEQVMRSALDAFGTARQVDKCLGEMHELGEVLLSHRYGEASAAQVIDEIADGFVVLGQMRLLYGPEAVDERIKVKLARLVRLVADQVASKPKPEPKPKPVLCWSPWQSGYILQVNGRWLGFVQPRDAMWTTDLGKGDLKWYPTMQEAMRAVELHHGLDEVPLWTP